MPSWWRSFQDVFFTPSQHDEPHNYSTNNDDTMEWSSRSSTGVDLLNSLQKELSQSTEQHYPDESRRPNANNSSPPVESPSSLEHDSSHRPSGKPVYSNTNMSEWQSPAVQMQTLLSKDLQETTRQNYAGE